MDTHPNTDSPAGSTIESARRRRRGRLFAGTSVMIATSAIVAGAAVSSNAMADEPTDEATVSMVQIGTTGVDGTEGYECTFDDAEFEAMFAAIDAELVAEAGDMVPPDAAPIAGGGAVAFEVAVEPGDLEAIEAYEGDVALPLPEGAEIVEGDLVAAGVIEVADESAALGLLPGEADLGFAADIRPGTAEECEALKAEFLDPAVVTMLPGEPATTPGS